MNPLDDLLDMVQGVLPLHQGVGVAVVPVVHQNV